MLVNGKLNTIPGRKRAYALRGDIPIYARRYDTIYSKLFYYILRFRLWITCLLYNTSIHSICSSLIGRELNSNFNLFQLILRGADLVLQ